nr:DUF2846 domain-containing protein [uncultured Carboxylicivirga sp.]
MKSVLITILLALSLTLSFGQSSDKATVYIIRTSGLGAAVNFKYFVGDQFIGKTNYGKYFKLELDPGEYVIWAKAENRDYVHATVEAGKTYLIDAVPQMGAFKAGVNLKALNNPTEKEWKIINKYFEKRKLLEYDEEKRALEQRDYADIIIKGLDHYNNKVVMARDLQRLTTPVEL